MQTLEVAGLTFEEALGALELTVRELEGESQTLEEAIALFERGLALARHCSERLDAAELRFREVQIGLGALEGDEDED